MCLDSVHNELSHAILSVLTQVSPHNMISHFCYNNFCPNCFSLFVVYDMIQLFVYNMIQLFQDIYVILIVISRYTYMYLLIKL